MADTERFWIAFGDIHEHIRHLDQIPHVEDAAGILVSGDLTNATGRPQAEHLLQSIALRNPVLHAQIGNMDTKEVDALLTERGVNVHGKIVDLGQGICLASVGYSTPTPFRTPSEVSEDQMIQWVRQVLVEAQNWEHVILMVHTPPHETALDRLHSGAHVGSPGVRAMIEEFQPALVITGHIHEAQGQDQIGRSRIYNPGSFAQGGYVRITHDSSGLRAELRSAV
ncbi:metallophosphoesterase [Desulfovibrionales bacterium]